jgi:hypothetical protein
MQCSPSTELTGAPASPIPPNEDGSIPRVSYRRQWLWAGLLAAATFWFFSDRVDKLIVDPPIPQRAEAGDWFFMLRLPEAPVDATAQRLYAERIESWITALEEAGFKPIRLQQALAAQAEGRLLPTRSVILAVDPGMRRTYETLNPLLMKRRWPAVWITPRRILKKPDTTYVSPHVIGEMNKSGIWEMAYSEADGQAFALDNAPKIPTLVWSPLTTRSAINRGSDTRLLNRIELNLTWNATQLVDVLLAEMPIRQSGFLLVKPTARGPLGYAVENAAMPPAPFQLEAQPDERFVRVMWSGTRGWMNSEIDFTASTWVGEMWLLLRSDPISREGLRVGIREGRIVVMADRTLQRALLARWDLPEQDSRRAHLKVSLVDDRLAVTFNGRSFPVVTVPLPSSRRGQVELALQDRVRGAAQAKDVEIFFKGL